MRSDEILTAATVFGLGAGATVMALDRGALAGATTWQEIIFPRSVPTDGAAAILRTLAADRRRYLIALECIVRPGQVTYLIGTPSERAAEVARLIRAILPGVVVELVRHEQLPLPRYAANVTLHGQHRPLQEGAGEAVARSVLAGLQGLAGDEAVILQYLLGSRITSRPVGPELPVTSATDAAREVLRGSATTPAAEQLRAARTKHADLGFRCAIRLGFAVGTKPRAQQLAAAALAGLRQAEAPGVRLGLHPAAPKPLVHATAPWRWPLRLNISELASLLVWPVGDGDYPGLGRNGPRLLPPAPGVATTGRVIGASTWPGTPRTVALTPEDSLRHLHLLAPTGAGKTTLLLNLILQDIAANRPVVVIDPQGDLVEGVLERMDQRRLDDAVVLDAAHTGPQVGLNPLASGLAPDLVADQLVGVLHSLYREHWGPRTADILHAGLLTLAKRPGTSICLLPLLLTNPAFRRHYTAGEDDVALAPFWSWYDQLSDAERAAAIAPVMNKLRPLMRPRLRAILGQTEPRFQMTDIFTKRRILLVSLAEGLLGPEAAALLGALVVAQLWQTTLGRAAVPAAKRLPAFVYVDEFQRLLHVPQDLGDVLARSRSAGVGWVLAHQHLAQLPPAMRAAVLSNARSRVVFQLTSDDAAVIARSSPELTAEDLQVLPAYHAYTSLVAGGAVTPFASIRTTPAPAAVRDAALVRQRSQDHYGVEPDVVEATLRVAGENGATGTGPAPAIGSRRRRTP